MVFLSLRVLNTTYLKISLIEYRPYSLLMFLQLLLFFIIQTQFPSLMQIYLIATNLMNNQSRVQLSECIAVLPEILFFLNGASSVCFGKFPSSLYRVDLYFE